MSAWILWVALTAGSLNSSMAMSAALYPTQEMCEAAAIKLKQDMTRFHVYTSCTETQAIR